MKRLKKANKDGMERQEDLMASAKVLQGRISSQNKVTNYALSSHKSFMLLTVSCYDSYSYLSLYSLSVSRKM